MQTRIFPGISSPVPICGLGGWALGGRAYGPVEREVARATLIRFIELGGVFIDTAEAYGASEEIIGEVVAELGCRERVVLATKTQRHHAADIHRALEQSLRRLHTERIDVYQIHAPPEDDGMMGEVLETFDALRQAGKIRVVGASVKGPVVNAHTIALGRRYIRTGRVQALQVIYSLLRPGNAEMFAEAAQAGVALIARTVLESGFLAGSYVPAHVFSPGDHRRRWSADQLQRILEAVQRLAADLPAGVSSVTELAIRFALSPPEVSVVIPGAKRPEQVERNWQAAAGPSLSETEVNALRRRLEGLQELVNPGVPASA
jgi:aryl-alcohol dehydrogenase-like predicted oxidoreductase